MECPDCAVAVVSFTVPEPYRDAVPDSENAVGLCPRCLSLYPFSEQRDHTTDECPHEPDFGRIGDAFPSNPDAGVPMALLVGLLDSLALYRSEIAELLAAVERAGVDPLLVLDRLAADPDVETDIDLTGRRRQLEQLL